MATLFRDASKGAAAGMLESSTVGALDAAGRLVLLDTMGVRTADDDWARRHFKNRNYQPPDGLQRPKDATVANLATLLG